MADNRTGKGRPGGNANNEPFEHTFDNRAWPPTPTIEEGLGLFYYGKEYTPGGERWFRQKLDAFVYWLDDTKGIRTFEALTPAVVREFIRFVRDAPSAKTDRPLSRHTAYGYAQAVKSFLNWCIREGWLDPHFTRNIQNPKPPEKLVPVLTPADIERLLLAARRNPDPRMAARNVAIVALLVDTGVRAEELCTLRTYDVHLEPYGSYIMVMGKGRKQREIGPLGDKTRAALGRWMYQYRRTFRQREGVDTAFLSKYSKPLTPVGLRSLMYRLADDAALPPQTRRNPHVFRHTFSYNYMTQPGADVAKLSRLLGHDSLQTTEHYLRGFGSREARQGESVLDTMLKDKGRNGNGHGHDGGGIGQLGWRRR